MNARAARAHIQGVPLSARRWAVSFYFSQWQRLYAIDEQVARVRANRPEGEKKVKEFEICAYRKT